MTPDQPTFDDALAAWRSDAVPSPDLAGRIAKAAVADIRLRRRVRTVARTAAGVTAVVALGLTVWLNHSAEDKLTASTTTLPDPFRTSNRLFAAAAKSVTSDVPSVNVPETIRIETTSYYRPPEPDRLLALPDAARAGVEPVSAPTSRAMNRFVKDLGAAFSLPKSKM
jgi:hypothetical protein